MPRPDWDSYAIHRAFAFLRARVRRRRRGFFLAAVARPAENAA